MTRRFQHADGQAAQRQRVALLIVPLVLLPHRGEQQVATAVGGGVLPVDVHRHVRVPLQQRPHGGGVVKMSVGQQDIPQGAAALLHQLLYPCGIVAGVDEGADLGVLVTQQIAVGHDGAHLQRLNGHGVLLTGCRCPE